MATDIPSALAEALAEAQAIPSIAWAAIDPDCAEDMLPPFVKRGIKVLYKVTGSTYEYQYATKLVFINTTTWVHYWSVGGAEPSLV